MDSTNEDILCKFVSELLLENLGIQFILVDDISKLHSRYTSLYPRSLYSIHFSCWVLPELEHSTIVWNTVPYVTSLDVLIQLGNSYFLLWSFCASTVVSSEEDSSHCCSWLCTLLCMWLGLGHQVSSAISPHLSISPSIVCNFSVKNTRITLKSCQI